MDREYFDLLVIVPLEEELHEVMKVFKAVNNYSTDNAFRYSVSGTNPDISILVVQQEGMGRTHAARAVANALKEFDFGLIVCLGIAGGMHRDMRLGDVCYTGNIIDVYDNSKARDTGGSIELEFSPTYHFTMREITTSFNFIRTFPELKESYVAWQTRQEEFAKSRAPNPILGREGKPEQLGSPRTMSGNIVCGVVSQSEQYNKKLRAVDRKILAIETESGGIFEEALNHKVPAIAVRGISDHADGKKQELEDETAGIIRKIAVTNAVTFLDLQLSNANFTNLLKARRENRTNRQLNTVPIKNPENTLAGIVADVGYAIDAKLRELSPEFKLQDKGYRLPVPRIRKINYETGVGGGSKSDSDQTDLRDVLQTRSTILLNLPRNYPDNSLPWVLADDLLTADIEGKQCIPIVIDGAEVRPPKNGLLALASDAIAAHFGKNQVFQPVFIVENLPLNSKTRLNFLIEQVKGLPESKFVFIARGDTNLLKENEFVGKLSAHVYSICDISFLEIAHFIQKNFSMSGSESEVIALRLRNTFEQFSLSAHPTYFAGIPRETLSALLQANRRAELIQLAVDGFLTFIVADDQSDVNLSRTTRSRFLRKLAVSLNLEKRSYSQSELVEFTKQFSGYHDFDIDPLAFIQGFVGKGILHFENDSVRFSLPFIASYLLALELKDDDGLALRYFQTADDDFDMATFDLYAELGASPEVTAQVLADLELSLKGYPISEGKHIFLTDRLRPVLLAKPGRVEALQQRLKEAAQDVQSNHDDAKQKQRILDIADQIREDAAEQSEGASSKPDEQPNEVYDRITHAVGIWAIATVLLGSGAEHLDGQTKQTLAKTLVNLAARILDEWTEVHANVDFEKIKERLTNEDILAEFSQKSPGETKEELESLVRSLVDVLEYSFLGEPFRRMIHHLCEQARHKVLATSVEKAKVDGVIENVIYATWLADIDTKRGSELLSEAIKELPPAPFFRVSLATHFLVRVYWSHWKSDDRLALLDAAEESIKPIQLQMNKDKLIRQIKSDEEPKKEA